MMRWAPLGLLLLGNAVAAKAPALPRDVRAFVDRRASCDHFRGEDSPDAERARQIADALVRSCTGTDRQLARLKRAYRTNPRVSAILRRYESRIER